MEVQAAQLQGLQGHTPEQLPQKTCPSPWQGAGRQALSSRHHHSPPSRFSGDRARQPHAE